MLYSYKGKCEVDGSNSGWDDEECVDSTFCSGAPPSRIVNAEGGEEVELVAVNRRDGSAPGYKGFKNGKRLR